MCDIIISMPWHCGNEDGCTVGWHQSNYWINEDEAEVNEGYAYTVDTYADGDHDPCTEEDLPSYEASQQAWKRYAEDVERTSEDPLGEFCVKQFKQVKERWDVRFSLSLRGYFITGVRRGRNERNAFDLPSHVKEFLCLSDSPYSHGPLIDLSREEFSRAGLKTGIWQSFLVEHRESRKASAYQRDLVRAAKRSAKRIAKDLRNVK